MSDPSGGQKTVVSEPTDPLCVACGTRACGLEPGTKSPPAFCPMRTVQDTLQSVERVYAEDEGVRGLALESARTEASGYGRRTRVEEVMDFADRLGVRKLGIAHCIGLIREARLAREVFAANGFAVATVCCKVGSIPKEEIGLRDDEKVHSGRYEALCNPVAQAAVLQQAGTELNVVIGLCVGHDSLFFQHSAAPATVLVAKDRVLGHNPVASLYTSHSYYGRLTDGTGETGRGSREEAS